MPFLSSPLNFFFCLEVSTDPLDLMADATSSLFYIPGGNYQIKLNKYFMND